MDDSFYKQLPKETKQLIKLFVPIWLRFGIESPPLLPQNHSQKYYNTVRRFPRGVKYKQTPYVLTIFFRRQHDSFKWTLDLEWIVNGSQYWMIRMAPQWAYDKDVVGCLLDLHPNFVNEVEIPSYAIFLRQGVRTIHHIKFPPQKKLELKFKVCRESIWNVPTYQTCVEDFVNYMKKLSHVAENLKKKKKYR